MSWTWDSTQITFDQTCWTFDGYNGCAWTGGGSDEYKYKSYADLVRDKEGIVAELHKDRILAEDVDIIQFLNIILTKGLL
jgi:hypothetical protein